MTQGIAEDVARIAPNKLTDLVEEMEAAVGQGDWDNAAGFFTADVLYRVGSRDPWRGLDGIRQYMDWQNTLVRWQGHKVRTKFARGEVAIFEVESQFLRLSDGSHLTIPCTDIYTFSAGRIADWRVYADTSTFNR